MWSFYLVNQRVLSFVTYVIFFHRSGENSRPFTIATFNQDDEEEEHVEEGIKGARDDPSVDVTNLETSDYHSATSSDCGSAASSDTEEETSKDGKAASAGEQKKEDVQTDAAQSDHNPITMIPRVRKRFEKALKKAKYTRNLVNVFFVPKYIEHFIGMVVYVTVDIAVWNLYGWKNNSRHFNIV